MPSAFPRLTSRQHAVVHTCRRLARGDRDAGRVLLDGWHLIQEAIRAGIPLHTIVVATAALDAASRADRAAVTAAAGAGTAVYEATAGVLESASPARTPSGIVAIADWSPAGVDAVCATAHALVVGLVDVQDPGNVGAVIRSADALGATGVAAIDRSADPGGWKALRGGMGSTFRVPVTRAALAETLAEAARHGLRVIATIAGAGATPIDRADLSQPSLLLVGNEGAGLAADLVARADERVTVPMRAGVNSINVAATAAIVLYEALRQRERPRAVR